MVKTVFENSKFLMFEISRKKNCLHATENFFFWKFSGRKNFNQKKIIFEKQFSFEIFLMFKINNSSLRSVSNWSGLWNCNPKEYSCSIDEMQHLFLGFRPIDQSDLVERCLSQSYEVIARVGNGPDVIIFCCDRTNSTFIFKKFVQVTHWWWMRLFWCH